MAIKLDYIHGLQFKAYSDNNGDYSILLDTAKDAGGNDEGIRPTDLLLVSLAGCSSMDIVSILKKKKQDISAYSVRIDGERADTHPRVFTKIVISIEIKGKNIEEAAVKRAVELAKEKYCSVWAMLEKASDIKVKYNIENEP